MIVIATSLVCFHHRCSGRLDQPILKLKCDVVCFLFSIAFVGFFVGYDPV